MVIGGKSTQTFPKNTPPYLLMALMALGVGPLLTCLRITASAAEPSFTVTLTTVPEYSIDIILFLFNWPFIEYSNGGSSI